MTASGGAMMPRQTLQEKNLMLFICVMLVNGLNIAAQLLIYFYAPEMADSKQSWLLMFISLSVSFAALGLSAMTDSEVHRKAWFRPLLAVTFILWLYAFVKVAKIIYFS